MKILAFADTHGSSGHSERILSLARKEGPDVIACAGDFSYFGQYWRDFLDEMCEIRSRLLIVAGNHESRQMMSEIIKDYDSVEDLHLRSVEAAGILFAGYGGADLFLDSVSAGERHDAELECFARGLVSTSGTKRLILVTHCPPYGTSVDFVDGRHVGMKQLREVVELLAPDYLITGHLHETAGRRGVIGRTLVVNPGPKGEILEIV